MGVEQLPLRIPEQWNAQWFQEFILRVLAPMDTRNSVGEGIDISADGNSVATLNATTAITAAVTAHNADASANPVAFAAHRAETDPHPDIIDDLTAASSAALSDKLIVSQSGTNKSTTVQQVHDALPVVYYTPASVTKNTGGTVAGSVAGVQTMLDGTVYTVDEVTGVPGFDIEFAWSSVTRTPAEIVLRLWYEGSISHDVHVEIWNYSTLAWVHVHTIVDHEDYEIAVLPIPVFTNFISGGAVKVRLYHETSGNASHVMRFDYVALRALR